MTRGDTPPTAPGPRRPALLIIEDMGLEQVKKREDEPTAAHTLWRVASGVEGALFRSVDRHGRVGGRLDGRDVARTLKELAARTGLATALVSGHSLRAGLATTAALAGRGDRAIMAQGRWKSRTMVDRYVRTADSWRDNAAAGLL
jgi:hypothetical protein